MIKLNAGFSRKVGEPNFGSRGASVNVELELESSLVGDPAGLAERIRGLFEVARRSVEEELATGCDPDDPSRNASPPSHRNGRAYRNHNDDRHTNGRETQQNGGARRGDRLATGSQVRAIRAICQRQKLDADGLAAERFGVRGVDELSVAEASTLIDELKANQNGEASHAYGGRGRAGGRR